MKSPTPAPAKPVSMPFIRVASIVQPGTNPSKLLLGTTTTSAIANPNVFQKSCGVSGVMIFAGVIIVAVQNPHDLPLSHSLNPHPVVRFSFQAFCCMARATGTQTQMTLAVPHLLAPTAQLHPSVPSAQRWCRGLLANAVLRHAWIKQARCDICVEIKIAARKPTSCASKSHGLDSNTPTVKKSSVLAIA